MIDRMMHPGEAMVIQGSSFRTKGQTPDEYHFHVSTLLRQPCQRPRVPSGIHPRPCWLCSRSSLSDAASETSSLTEHQTLTSAFPPRLRVRPTTRKPAPRSAKLQAASRRGQISGWKARATSIGVHSWFIRQAVESHPTRDTPLPWTVAPTCLSRTLATPPHCCAAQPVTTIEQNQNSAQKTGCAEPVGTVSTP